MDLLKITISTWTSSFRQPLIISGMQLTYPIPPPSTIYGLLSAVKGEIIKCDSIRFSYFFMTKGKQVDLETIYESNSTTNVNSNIYKREFLYNNKLILYIDDLEFEEYLKHPRYTVLLGRSSDLAQIKSYKKVRVNQTNQGNFMNTLIPATSELKISVGSLYRMPVFLSEGNKKHRTLEKSNLFYYLEKNNYIKFSNNSVFEDPNENSQFVFIN